MNTTLHLVTLAAMLAVACGSGGGPSSGGVGPDGSMGATSSGGATGSGGATSSGGTHSATGGTGTGGTRCGGATCRAKQACVAYRVEGGGPLFPDAGRCPEGTHVETVGVANVRCGRDFAYECVELAGCTSENVACSCGACPSPYSACSDPGTIAGLEPGTQLVCQELAP